jgi:glycosyltransferase involved in cell wall biosynthesis
VTDVGATTELVDASNGAILKKASATSIKKNLLAIFDSTSEHWQSLGHNGRQKVLLTFNWERIARMHLEVFHELGLPQQEPSTDFPT